MDSPKLPGHVNHTKHLACPAIKKPKPLWTGRQILLLAIPKSITIYCSPDPKSAIPSSVDGMNAEKDEIVNGKVDKEIVGATMVGLIHLVFVFCCFVFCFCLFSFVL